MLRQVAEAGLAGVIEVDSAGTGNWHIGEAPDPRAQQAARTRGYDLSPLRARQIHADDFARFDLVLAMDDANLAELRRRCPSEHAGKLRLLGEFGSRAAEREIADPYFGGPQGFEQVLDECEDACAGLLAVLRERVSGRASE
ncbi:MAG: Low molecular weight protein-tyrosine-phosphatase YfkJ [Burkholderia plantarii]|nr:MAG: Low molecular weight protein-tyrosine-phosphatase YfkJ [Burkholderia plantarii]